MIFNVAIICVKGNAYKIHFWYMSKDYAISMVNNSNLIDKKVFYNFFTVYTKSMWEKLLSKKQRCDTKESKRLLWKR